MKSAPQPLSTRTVIEVCQDASDDVTRLSIAFAGRIAASLGAHVVSVHADGVDPLEGWGPALPNGSTAMATFLNHGKASSRTVPSGRADLLTNDAELGREWGQGAAVVIDAPFRGASGPSELTLLAASGLLDILGEPGRPPLALPGNQIAYSAGVAAFDALVSSIFADMVSGKTLQSAVSVIDVAEWLNWKHFLAAHVGQPDTGIGRAEDWSTAQCADGHIAVVFQDKDMPALAALVGDPALAEPRFATLKARRRNIAAFNTIMSGWAQRQRRDDIVSRAREKRLPFGPVLTVPDLFVDKQMLSRTFLELDPDSPRFGTPRLPAVWNGAA